MKLSSAPGERFCNKTNSEFLSHLAKDFVPEYDFEHFLKIAKEEIAALNGSIKNPGLAAVDGLQLMHGERVRSVPLKNLGAPFCCRTPDAGPAWTARVHKA